MMLNSTETFYTKVRVNPRRQVTTTIIPTSPSNNTPTLCTPGALTPSNSPSNVPNAIPSSFSSPSNSTATPNPSQNRDPPTNNSNSETTKLSDDS